MESTRQQNFSRPHPKTAGTYRPANKTNKYPLDHPPIKSLPQHNLLKAQQTANNENGRIQTAGLDGLARITPPLEKRRTPAATKNYPAAVRTTTPNKRKKPDEISPKRTLVHNDEP